MKHSLFLFVLSSLVPCYTSLKGDVVGCYTSDPFSITASGDSVDSCIWACEQLYYRYAALNNGFHCFCGNVPGGVVADPSLCNFGCQRNASQLCGGENVNSVYDTGFLVHGPPYQISVTNVTENSFYMQWKEPLAHGLITGYKINCRVIKTFDTEHENTNRELLYPNTTLLAHVEGLHPGTEYNVTISALTAEVGKAGVEAVLRVETVIGVPEPSPLEATILERRGEHMTISIPRSTNINGPISKYRVVVINKEFEQGFLPEYLKNYNEASREGLTYYITAQLEPGDIEQSFTVGNRISYDGYYNAALPKGKDFQIAIGVVSIKNGVTKTRYTHSTDIAILNVGEVEDKSGMVVVLGVAIALGVILLLAGLGIILVLRRRVGNIRRQRLSQSMPLSGPCVEIENTGFIPDEEQRVDHYSNLKRQLWNIPRNFLEVDMSLMVGMGNFGRYIRARVQHQGTYKPGLVQVIPDGELSRNDKREMLGELDLLIKANGHENVVALIGICEIPDALYVVLEDNRHTLKELLLSARHMDAHDNKFALIGESDVIKIALDVCKGMEYLASKKIFHKRLCCRNIIMTDGNTPKVSGFGLSHIYNLNEKPDYTRWTAVEMFKQSTYHIKSDVWSFGCLLWELLSLGGTPYPNIMNKDVPSRVMRGARPPQLYYVGDDLYQLCLHCWQLDLDERPTFLDLASSLDSILNQFTAAVLSFSNYSGFNYEAQFNELEMYLGM